MISDVYRFIFVHINKTGGTSIEKLFDREADQRDVRLKHASISYYQRKFPEQFELYFKFAFVRNPWDWLVSRYHWSRDVQKLFDYSFETFLQHLKSGAELSEKAPWLRDALESQVSRLKINGQIAVDFIGRFEDIQADFEKVCDTLDLMQVPLPHVFASKHKHYTQYYTPETQAIVAELYAEDIEYFAYQFEEKAIISQSLSSPLPEAESDPINTIRTFWSGPPMSLYEKICLRSFVKLGHRVEVYSYGIISKIEGVIWRNAAEILPESEVFTYRSGADKGSLAGFANLFRYHLLYEKGGTWADLDVFCFKSMHDLPEACVGLESPNLANNALLRFPPRHPLVKELRDRAKALGQDIHMGQTGPYLLTDLLKDYADQVVILPEHAFYPLPWHAAWKPFLPDEREACETAVQGAYCLHLWNQILNRIGIRKQKLPPKGSFLYQLALSVLEQNTDESYALDQVEPLIQQWRQEEAKQNFIKLLKSFPFARGYPDKLPAIDLDERPLKRRLIIWPAMLPENQGRNINGPSLIRVPDWIQKPLGRYYLYFAHHKGRFIRLAYADHVAGPWTIHEPGSLHLEQTICLQQNQGRIEAHIASPDVHVDHARQQIRMYFHGQLPHSEFLDNTDALQQASFCAVSADGLNFEAGSEILGNPYFRVFQWQGCFYALSMPGQFYRSQDGLSGFEPGPSPFPPQMRHAAVLVQGNKLFVLYSCIGDKPEALLFATVDLTQPFEQWKPSNPVRALVPQTHWEGVNLPVTVSQRGPVYKPVHQLRDPAFFAEDGRIYVVYSAAGEWGLAISELALKAKGTKK